VRRAGARLVDVDDELIAEFAGRGFRPPAWTMASAIAGRGAPSAAFARAHACFDEHVAVTSGAGAFRPLIGKFSTARSVWTP
jgi:hypothetical protein